MINYIAGAVLSSLSLSIADSYLLKNNQRISPTYGVWYNQEKRAEVSISNDILFYIEVDGIRSIAKSVPCNSRGSVFCFIKKEFGPEIKCSYNLIISKSGYNAYFMIYDGSKISCPEGIFHKISNDNREN